MNRVFLALLIVPFIISPLSGVLSYSSLAGELANISDQGRHNGSSSGTTLSAQTPAVHSESPVCEAVKKYPRLEIDKPPLETGEISPICKPFVKLKRQDLDRCGDVKKDPYSSATTRARTTSSGFTWASRNEMEQKGKVNLYTDAILRPKLAGVVKRIADLKTSARQMCCGGDRSCDRAFERVQVTFCKPSTDPNAPDPCVFGGSYKMPGDGYSAIFRAINKVYGSEQSQAFKHLAERNLTSQELGDAKPLDGLMSGSIVLSSYVPKSTGAAAIEPILLHEFGHACSMIKMQNWALDGRKQEASNQPAAPERVQRALRATKWLDSARDRCNPDLELPEGYYDFWESVGESRGFAGCLYQLAADNQKQLVDRACPGLCPGHYLEESVGIAFSLLLGDLKGQAGSVFPNTCDHVRDGQHPMVSDVADCLMQNSPRFRARMKATYNCQ